MSPYLATSWFKVDGVDILRKLHANDTFLNDSQHHQYFDALNSDISQLAYYLVFSQIYVSYRHSLFMKSC